MKFLQSDVSLVSALGDSILGMAIVFAVLIMLIVVVKVIEKLTKAIQPEEASAAAPVPAAAAPAPAQPAPGTAGELKLYNVEPRDAAMVMAIVADSLGKPLNQLRFISIREVTEP